MFWNEYLVFWNENLVFWNENLVFWDGKQPTLISFRVFLGIYQPGFGPKFQLAGVFITYFLRVGQTIPVDRDNGIWFGGFDAVCPHRLCCRTPTGSLETNFVCFSLTVLSGSSVFCFIALVWSCFLIFF